MSMRLINSPRYLAAVYFLLPAAQCLGIVAIIINAGMPLPEMLAPGAPGRQTYLFLCGAFVVALVLMTLLLSPIHFSRSGRLFLLLLCVAAAIASLKFAQVVILSWLLPTWYVYRFFREPAA